MYSFLFLIMSLLMLFASPAAAKSLEDILREKGVITEEEYRQLARDSALSYKPGEGFTFRSSDGRFTTSFGGMLQLRYTLLDADEANDAYTEQAPNVSKFELRRIKAFFNGSAFTEDLVYKLQLNFANLQGGSTTNGGILEEAYLNYRVTNEFQFRFGQDKMPFGRQFITSTALLQFPDISVATAAFVPGYDIGALIHGTVLEGILAYKVGGYGGVGQNTFRSTSDNSFAGRLTLDPLGEMKYGESDVEQSASPLFSFGANYFLNTLNPGTSNGRESNQLYFGKSTGWYTIGSATMPAGFQGGEAVDFELVGFDGAFKWQGLSLQGEYFLAEAAGDTTGATLRGSGWYAQTGYFVVPAHLEVAGRYSYIDPNRSMSNDLWTEAAGVGSYFFQGHNLKIQAEYSIIHKQRLVSFNAGPGTTDDRQIRLQAQLLF
jgi:phosphate-selective porin OprO and OprP